MELISINVGTPREVDWNGKSVRTAIYKDPVDGPAAVHRLGVAGDAQANPDAHGGADKAVYAYSAEHYGAWAAELGVDELPWGALGENLTLRGAELLEDAVRIGDRVRVGAAELLVTHPRMPCYKLGIRLGTQDVVGRMIETGRCGFYCAVSREGEVEAKDTVEIVERDPESLTIGQVFALRSGRAGGAGSRVEQELLRRAAELPALPAEWREHFAGRLG